LLIKKKRGSLVVISSPSGAGKTTITKKLISQNKNMELSVSLTTRQPRKKEVQNIDYQFVEKKFFKKKIINGSFLEYAKVFDNYYGTLKKDILKKIKKNKIIILDIDWQGARQIKEKVPNLVTSIFIMPPSLNELKKRLIKREKDISFVNKRMAKAKKEIMHWKEYDFVVVNDNLQKCLKEINQILITIKKKPNNFQI
jgi:guanylate kinase